MQPLQVELGRDPQVEVAVERVVVGDERPRQGAAVDRLQDRRLDLDEAVAVEQAPDLRDHLGPGDEGLAHVGVGDQVELAMAVARLDVGEPVVLVRQRPQALGERLPGVDAQGELAAAAHEGGAVDADVVAEVHRDQQLVHVLAEHVEPRLQLDLAAAVAEVDEGRLAHPAPAHDPAGDAVGAVGLLAGLEAVVLGPHRRRSRCGRRTCAGTGRSRPRAGARASRGARRSACPRWGALLRSRAGLPRP